MENTSKPQTEPSSGMPGVPPRKPSGNGKWYAIIAVLIVIIAALGVLGFYHPVSTGSSVTTVSAPQSASLGTPYNLVLKTNGQWDSMNVYFGDGSNVFVPYTGSDTVNLSHTYNDAGSYTIYYTVNFGSTTYNNSKNLLPVVINPASVNVNPNAALGSLFFINSTANPYTNGTLTVNPQTNMQFSIGLQGLPGAPFAVYSQMVNIYLNGQLNQTETVPYSFNYTSGAYQLPLNSAVFNVTNASYGYYVVQLVTYAGAVVTNTYTVNNPFTHSTVAPSNGSVTYNRTVTFHYANGTLYNSSVLVQYSNGTGLTNEANTGLNYTSDANVTYATSVEVLNAADNTMSYLPGTNLTFNKETNVSFLANTSAKNLTGAVNTYVVSKTYTLMPGDVLNFTKPTTMFLNNSADITYAKDSTVYYMSGANLTLVDPVMSIYHMLSTVFYTNKQTIVDYPGMTNVTLITTQEGTTTVNLNTGTIDPTQGVYTTSYYVDVPVFSQAVVNVPVLGAPTYVPSSSGGTFTNGELETGGYKTLDPAVAYDTVSFEILLNTLQFLDQYNGSSSSSFIPELASQLPTTSNGGINTNFANYTVTSPWGVKYAVNVTPYENYTFHINHGIKWADGSSVTAWDVMYSFTRTLLYDAGSPGTPGWIQAQYLLPGDYYSTNTFWNITQNITVNNNTNNVTFHFQFPMAPSLVYEVFAASGAFVMDANWTAHNGAGITWTPAGFEAYKAHASQSDYFTYLVNNIMPDGPYKIAFNIPSQEIVLQANPSFSSSDMKYYPKAHFGTVIIRYIASPQTNYLLLKSGGAQTAGIPSSSWDLVQGLQSQGIVNTTGFPTLSIFWYNFNANVNTSMLAGLVPGSNLPGSMFSSLHVRQAFAYAYNYTNYLANDIGNALFNVTFANSYAGMLPAGMLGQQSISQLNNLTNGVPYYNVTMAKQQWNAFVNGSEGKALGVTWSGSAFVYKGSPLNIPLYIFSADPVDLAGATQWGAVLSQVITGASFPVEPTAFPTLLGNQVQGSNPMPVYELGWAPDYPFPSDYLGPMALPSNASTYPGPNSMVPYWFSSASGNPIANTTQEGMLNAMVQDWKNASSTGNQTVQLTNYHMMNEMLINMTMYVYIEQTYEHFILSTSINMPQVVANQQNVMIGGGADFLYNYFLPA